jgi:phage repressor protein C with HTH and peptisase S24 domain
MALAVKKDLNWIVSGTNTDPMILKDKQKESETIKYPEYKLESTIPAGDGDIVDLTDWYHSDVLDYDPQHHFFLKVDEQFGLSMMPLIRPGDLLLCSTRARVKSGDIVAAKWDKNKGAVKIASFPKNDNMNVLLMSYNQAYEPFSVPRKQTKMYKVVLIKKS